MCEIIGSKAKRKRRLMIAIAMLNNTAVNITMKKNVIKETMKNVVRI